MCNFLSPTDDPSFASQLNSEHVEIKRNVLRVDATFCLVKRKAELGMRRPGVSPSPRPCPRPPPAASHPRPASSASAASSPCDYLDITTTIYRYIHQRI